MKLNKLKPFIYCTIAAVLFSVLRIYDPYPVEILRLKGLDYYQKTLDSLNKVGLEDNYIHKLVKAAVLETTV